jgi:hypothetical protein
MAGDGWLCVVCLCLCACTTELSVRRSSGGCRFMRVVRRASCAAVRDVGREGCGRVTTLYVLCCRFFFGWDGRIGKYLPGYSGQWMD